MNFRRLAVMVFAGLSLTACLGEGIDVDTTVVSHPWLSVEHVYRGAGFNEEDFGYVDDELTGFTVHLTEADAAKHGIASPLLFVGISAGRANVDADMTAYGTDGTHEQWVASNPSKYVTRTVKPLSLLKTSALSARGLTPESDFGSLATSSPATETKSSGFTTHRTV